jgi:hypothetical protein
MFESFGGRPQQKVMCVKRRRGFKVGRTYSVQNHFTSDTGEDIIVLKNRWGSPKVFNYFSDNFTTYFREV